MMMMMMMMMMKVSQMVLKSLEMIKKSGHKIREIDHSLFIKTTATGGNISGGVVLDSKNGSRKKGRNIFNQGGITIPPGLTEGEAIGALICKAFPPATAKETTTTPMVGKVIVQYWRTM